MKNKTIDCEQNVSNGKNTKNTSNNTSILKENAGKIKPKAEHLFRLTLKK